MIHFLLCDRERPKSLKDGAGDSAGFSEDVSVVVAFELEVEEAEISPADCVIIRREEDFFDGELLFSFPFSFC